jgi:hypothetical protein
VDRHARVTVRQCLYSVPARLIGRTVRVQLGASQVRVFDGKTQVAVHERVIARGGQSLILDHYLEVLLRKPGGLPGATALQQARNSGAFTPAHEAFWAMARARLGDAAGTRALVEVLLLHRRMTAADVHAGMTAAMRLENLSPDVVAVEARRAGGRPDPGPLPLPLALPRRAKPHGDDLDQVTVLPTDPRPLPTVAHYDSLLTRDA